MKKLFTIAFAFLLFSSCSDDDGPSAPQENPSTFKEIDELTLSGGETAAEISTYDPLTKKLFVVNAVSASIDVVDISTPSNAIYEQSIDISSYGGNVNSVSVKD